MGYSLYMDSRSRNEFLPPSTASLKAPRIPRASSAGWPSKDAAMAESERVAVECSGRYSLHFARGSAETVRPGRK